MIIISNYETEYNEKKIFLITSKEECICPCCGGSLKYRDRRLRIHKMAGGIKEWHLIRRLKCTNAACGKLHNELPDIMFPYKHYDAGLIEDVVDEAVSEDDLETEDYPCEGTINHWKWWAQMNEKNMEGQIRLAAHRFLDFNDGFLKSRDSLLEDLRRRISPGWLKITARFIYNSGGRIPPHLKNAPAFIRCHPAIGVYLFLKRYLAKYAGREENFIKELGNRACGRFRASCFINCAQF